MRHVINRHKRRFVHINDEGQPLWKVRCGAWSYYGPSYVTDLEVVPPADVNLYHQCKKCIKQGLGVWPNFSQEL
jgi:hypothetical protein